MGDVCPEYADALVDFSDGELSAEERRAVQEHVAACPACRAELGRLDASLSRLVNGMVIGPVVGREPTRFSSRLGSIAAIAASVLLCLSAVYWTALRRAESKVAKAEPSPGVETGSAARISSHDALWQIALVEEQARLQTSLELLPKDEAFEEQRREDERLLAKFQSMA